MAQALRDYRVTPADELRALIGESENLAGQPGANAEVVHTLLANLDRIAELWPELEAAGVDLRPEQGRRATLEAHIHRLAPRIVRRVGATGLRTEREKRYRENPAAAPWWWRLDEEVCAARFRRTRRNITLIVGLLLVGFLGVTVFNLLFPVDPAVRDSASAQMRGQQLADNGDYPGALAEFRRAVELTPGDAEAQMRWGIAQQKLGDEAGAQKAFEAARALLPNEIEFRLTRVALYYSYHMYAESEADVDAVLAVDPQEPRAYYFRASVLEEQGRLAEAVDALDLAGRYAEARGDNELNAMARYRLAILVQQRPAEPVATPGAGDK